MPCSMLKLKPNSLPMLILSETDKSLICQIANTGHGFLL